MEQGPERTKIAWHVFIQWMAHVGFLDTWLRHNRNLPDTKGVHGRFNPYHTDFRDSYRFLSIIMGTEYFPLDDEGQELWSKAAVEWEKVAEKLVEVLDAYP